MYVPPSPNNEKMLPLRSGMVLCRGCISTFEKHVRHDKPCAAFRPEFFLGTFPTMPLSTHPTAIGVGLVVGLSVSCGYG